MRYTIHCHIYNLNQTQFRYILSMYAYCSSPCLSRYILHLAGPLDYVPENSVKRLAACQPRACIPIAIIDDTFREGIEVFYVRISNVRSVEEDPRVRRIRISQSQAQVFINDNDS